MKENTKALKNLQKLDFISKSIQLLIREDTMDIVENCEMLEETSILELLKVQSSLVDKILNSVAEGIIITDKNGIILWGNDAFTDITGYTIDEAIGKKTSLLKSDRHDYKFYKDMWESLISKGHWQGEIWNRRKSGEAYLEMLTIKSIKSQDNINYISIFTDMTDTKTKNSSINHNINYDPLTGLPNRLLLNEKLKIALEYANTHSIKISVLFLNLDDFKKVNDGLGFEIGDMLLKEVSDKIKSTLNSTDIVARIGADEFLIVNYGIRTTEELNRVINSVLKIFNDKFVIKGNDIYITASIGASVYPQDGVQGATLIKRSNLAMYRSKKQVGNTYEIYGDLNVTNDTILNKIKLENDLREALEREELEIYYQPKIDISTMKIKGLEALIRWNHPIKGFISPNKFISMAEKNGLIEPIGDWVLKKSCEQSIIWQQKGYEPLVMSVNISAMQFRSRHIVNAVKGVIHRTGIRPELLELEITETIAMESVEYTYEIMRELKEIGVTFSLDDFGTGYSSLFYLKEFPYDTVKIDKSFVDDITKTENDLKLVKSIISMAHSLNLRVVAEGAETKEQVVALSEINCDQIQGYYFYPPLKANDVENILYNGTTIN
ncbi:EAL domain-containing protein [Clostridiaceae bacterium M8S5]|nr:EAL domain-containing protein [Clostridiaceae bacterium M8S5]